jgi:dTDP-glucose pyrophosphorylase
MNALLLMAGPNDQFANAGYSYPKNLIEIEGLPLVQHVLEGVSSLSKAGWKFTIVVRKDEQEKSHTASVIQLLVPDAKVLAIPKQTGGAACSALIALDQINNEEPLVICNGDQILDIDLAKVMKEFIDKKFDAGTIGFHAVHPRWSYVRCNDEGLVVEAAEKRPISNFATAGVYFYRQGKLFVEAAMEMIRKDANVGGQFYVCPTFNEMVLRHARIGTNEIDR